MLRDVIVLDAWEPITRKNITLAMRALLPVIDGRDPQRVAVDLAIAEGVRPTDVRDAVRRYCSWRGRDGLSEDDEVKLMRMWCQRATETGVRPIDMGGPRNRTLEFTPETQAAEFARG